MESRQNRKSKISIYSILDTMSYLLVFLAAMSFMLSSIALLPTPIGIVTSRSMEPLMTIGDVVFIQPMAVRDTKLGDIIAYESPPDKTIIHRVVGIAELPGKIYLTTKGDANPVTDQSVGFPPVSERNLIGKVFCLNGFPVRIPIIGIYMIHARNFAIWLTQNKIWAFWGPLVVMVYVFGPYLSPRGISRFDLRKSLRTRIPVKKLLLYALISFVGISAFTFYFKTETYSLSMRVACLLEDKEPAYISFGSMIYEEVKNNTIEVTGAPMFPVKTVVITLGNASRLVTPIPQTMRVEPQEYTELVLQARIPPRGQIESGIYKANVHIFSDALLLMLPDSMIFSVFYAIRNPWVSLILLDIFAASALALVISFFAVIINYTSEQILYTIVWRDELEATPPHILRIKLHNFKVKASRAFQRISMNIAKFSIFIKREAELRKIWKPSILAVIPSALLFLLIDNLLLPVTMLSLSLSVLAWKFHTKSKENLATSAALANLLLSITFIARRVVIVLYSQINMFWCMISAGFVGNFSYMLTMPLIMAITLASFLILEWAKIWYLEQQTINWSIMRAGEVTIIEKKIKIPSLEDYERLEKRKLKIEIPKVPSRVTLILRKAGKYLIRLRREIVSSIVSLRLRTYVAFLSVKMMENRLLKRETTLLFKIKSFEGMLKSITSGTINLAANAILLIRLSVFKIVRIIRWRWTF